MKTMTRQASLAAIAAVAVLTLATAGCGPALFDVVRPAASGDPVVLSEQVAPSALVAVTGAGAPNGRLFQIIGETARPLEHLTIVPALVASSAPAPATVRIAAKPPPPPPGATSYQEAEYQEGMARWDAELAAGQREVASRTAAATDTWVRGQLARVGSARPASASPAGASPAGASLAAECGLAGSVLTGLVDQAGARFGGRVVLLAVASLDGMPPAGELGGADVIVLTPFLPSAADAAAAQEKLIAGGAARASVLGPEATAAELAQLVTDGLGVRQVSESLSGPALFANDSAVLLPAATRVLTPLLSLLRQPGATAVINGYASAPGGVQLNQQLSEKRAAAVAAFLEAHGVGAPALLVVGHGASDFVGPASSPDNRRVVVVIEEPA
jgi:outer membrane protein OmpA-like peptidoglycan-associated protein